METVTLNVSGLKFFGDIILVILGILALVFIAMFFKNANNLVKSAKSIVDKNSSSIEDTMDKLPGLLEDARNLVDKAEGIVSDPNLKETIAKANDTMTNVKLMTDDLKDTVNYLGEGVVDTTDAFADGIGSIKDYASMITDAIDIARSIFHGK